MMTDAWGIDDGYHGVDGKWHPTSPDTRRALRVAMGGDPDDEHPPATRPVWVVRRGDSHALLGPCVIETETGEERPAETHVPLDLPVGYHDLVPDDGGPTTRLIVAPRRAHPPPERAWGLAVQLYAARSPASWGHGDLGDLARIARWARDHEAGFVQINPLHAPLPLPRQLPSPYYPSSRRHRNPLYLRIEDIAGASVPGVERLAVAGRSMRLTDRIDHDRVWALKVDALTSVFSRTDTARADGLTDADDHDLTQYATFCALAEHHGSGWRSWPGEHRDPDGAGVGAFAASHDERVRFWCWVQGLLDRQVHAAASTTPLLADLAIGVDPDGYEAWADREVYAADLTVGAPPDDFNPAGQDWGIPPMVPWRLRETAYAPLAETWRANLLPGCGLRVDHVMGLSRIYCIPAGATPGEGAYVRFPGTDLLDVLTVESDRAGAFVVGEDLGTVEGHLRGWLADRGILSTVLVLFEDRPPAEYPEACLAAVTTHDLPTVRGLLTGADLDDQRAAGLDPAEEAAATLASRLRRAAGTDDPDPAAVAAAIHERLAASRSRLVAVGLDDLVGAVRRPNMPGTVDEHPNWRIPIPGGLEQALGDASEPAGSARRNPEKSLKAHPD